MIASAFLLPGIGIGLSAALKTSLIVSGALMAVQGVVALFQKAPSASKSDDPAAVEISRRHEEHDGTGHAHHTGLRSSSAPRPFDPTSVRRCPAFLRHFPGPTDHLNTSPALARFASPYQHRY